MDGSYNDTPWGLQHIQARAAADAEKISQQQQDSRRQAPGSSLAYRGGGDDASRRRDFDDTDGPGQAVISTIPVEVHAGNDDAFWSDEESRGQHSGSGRKGPYATSDQHSRAESIVGVGGGSLEAVGEEENEPPALGGSSNSRPRFVGF